MSPGTRPAPTRLRWRPRAYLLWAGAAGLLLAAVAERDPVPIFLAIPFLLAGPAAALAGPRESPALGGHWEAEGSAAEVVVSGTLRAAERVDARDLVLAAPAPPGLTEVAPPVLDRAPGELRFRLRWQAREPTIVVAPPPEIVWRDATGLVERSATLDLPPLIVERYPPELLGIGAVRLRRTTSLPGESIARTIGVAGEFHGIREAVADDPPRRINWPASARQGRLLANEFQVERTGDVLLVLDTRMSSLGPAADARLLALSRAAAAGISNAFLRVKARVGLAVFAEFVTAVPLATGRRQQMRIRSALLGAHPDSSDAPSERCAIALRRYFPPGVTTILLSTLADENRADLVPHLRRRGFPVLTLSPSPLPLTLEGPPLPTADEALVVRLTRLVRREQIARAWEEAPAIDWDDFWSLGRFVDFLRRPDVRRVG